MCDILKGIKNIIFDYGGVILDLDMPRCVNEFAKLGVKNMGHMYSMASQDELFVRLEKGLIEEDIFYESIRELLPNNPGNIEIEYAWNAMLGKMPKERIDLIDRLNKGSEYRTFLLSNTNGIHYRKYVRDLKKEFGFNDFSELFEKDYFSHKINMKKPDCEIFEFVLNDSGLKAEETLFIDDSPVNIKGAEALGIRSFLLPPEIGIVELFPDFSI